MVLESLRFISSGNDYHRQLLDRWLPSGLIVDVGCGLGRVALHYTSRERRFIALDTDYAAVRAATRHGKHFLVGDAFALPLGDGIADGVVGIGIIDLDPCGPSHALAEMRRVLCPGGLLYVTFAFCNLPRRLGWTAIFPRATWRGQKVREFEEQEVRALVGAVGFRISEVRPSSIAWGLGRLRLLSLVLRAALLREDEASPSYRLLGPLARRLANLLVVVAHKT